MVPLFINPPNFSQSQWSHCPPPSDSLPPTPISLVPHLIGPFSSAGAPIHKSPPHCLNSLFLHLIGPPMLPFLPCSHWSPISLVPHCNPLYPVLIGPPSHWSPNVTLSTLFSLVPHLIGPPMRPWLHSSHWSPISLVPHCNPFYPVLIGSPSHWSPNVTLSTLFSLVPHLIGPPLWPWLHSSHWCSISLVPQCNPGYTALIGPPSHWLPLVTLPTLLSLVPHLIGPISEPKGSVLSTPQILDPSIKDLYQYQPWNHTHRAQLTESMHMPYHTTALLPNSCGPMADGPFRDSMGEISWLILI